MSKARLRFAQDRPELREEFADPFVHHPSTGVAVHPGDYILAEETAYMTSRSISAGRCGMQCLTLAGRNHIASSYGTQKLLLTDVECSS